MPISPDAQPTRLILTLTPHNSDDGYAVHVETQDLWSNESVALGGCVTDSLDRALDFVNRRIGAHYAALRTLPRAARLFP